ncbi:hypothetical protein C809_02151 [Lachnospiraceae bacterium MD335]|nr:hypothetical protein C809_02151 [Lachnospiraceae bacterium MD335]
MSNINDSFIRISEIMRNSILSFDISAEVKESITRMNDQVKNIVKVYDSTLFMQNQRKFIEMSTQVTKQLRDSMEIMRDIDNLSELSKNLAQFAKVIDVSYKDMCKILQQYDYAKLTKIMQDTLKAYDYNNPFDVNIITEQITEAYIAGEEDEQNEYIETKDKKEYVKDIRDWVSFCIATISFFISIYSLVSTKPSNTYNTTIEVNNYYVNDLEISAGMLNAMSYRIIVKNDVMPRIKPDCSSCVMGHLNIGQVVTVSRKYKKWVKIEWEDECGNYYSGWVQNYKLAKFK